MIPFDGVLSGIVVRCPQFDQEVLPNLLLWKGNNIYLGFRYVVYDISAQAYDIL